MKKNVGIADKIVRLFIAAIVAALFFKGTVTGATGIVMLAAAFVLTLTSLINFCPLYTIFGINSNKK